VNAHLSAKAIRQEIERCLTTPWLPLDTLTGWQDDEHYLPTEDELDCVHDMVKLTQHIAGYDRTPPPEIAAACTLWRPRFARLHVARCRGLPRRLWAASLEHGEQTALLHRARVFAERDITEGRALTLAGPPGVGKSYAAAASLNTLPVPASPAYLYFPALCRRLLDFDTRDLALAHACAPHCVVFDDVGVEYVKADGLLASLIDEIISQREGTSYPTLLTTNLPPDDLRRHLGERVWDRLQGAAWGQLYVCAGPSRRAGAR
jgi:hypothetical protein